MSGRISVFEGKLPVLIVAPHAPDDHNTEVIAKAIINDLSCYGVINHGWRSAFAYNYKTEQANCNNISHIHKDVIKDEFLRPILRYHKKVRNVSPIMYMFTIHGVGKAVRHEANDPTLDLIVGFGAGKPPAYTCDFWRKNLLIHILRSGGGITVYEGKPRSKYAARHKNNLTQLFNLGCWYPDKGTHSMQIEIIEDLRDEKETAEITGLFLADAIRSLFKAAAWNAPTNFTVKQI